MNAQLNRYALSCEAKKFIFIRLRGEPEVPSSPLSRRGKLISSSMRIEIKDETKRGRRDGGYTRGERNTSHGGFRPDEFAESSVESRMSARDTITELFD